jgi:hypothetical protein
MPSRKKVSRSDCEKDNKITVNRNGKIHCRSRSTKNKSRSTKRSRKISSKSSYKPYGESYDLNNKTVQELKYHARSRGLGYYSGLNKADLIQYIKDNINIETGRSRKIRRSR